MFKEKNKLYLFVIIACVFGYIWILYQLLTENQNNNITICYFKNITKYPCPSCGSTRSVLSIFQGNIIKSILINPLGNIVFLIMFFSPIWILFDILLKKDSYFKSFLIFERNIKKPKVYIPILLLILINWIWNINKQL